MWLGRRESRARRRLGVEAGLICVGKCWGGLGGRILRAGARSGKGWGGEGE